MSLICYICIVKLIRNIFVLILVTVYLVSSAGILVFKSHCCCAPGEQLSVYKNPETCNPEKGEYFAHILGGNHSSDIETQNNNSDKSNCGCNGPKVFYFKLNNQAEKIASTHQKIQIPVTGEIIYSIHTDVLGEFLTIFTPGNYSEPPPLNNNSIEFLIQIHQLKIPSVA